MKVQGKQKEVKIKLEIYLTPYMTELKLISKNACSRDKSIRRDRKRICKISAHFNLMYRAVKI